MQKADVIIFGPGSLYTSIVSNILVQGFIETVEKNESAILIYVSNIMTQASESYKFLLSDHIKVIEKYLGQKLHYIIANQRILPEEILESYKKEMSEPVRIDIEDERIIRDDLVEIIIDKDGRKKVRHDPLKLASLIMNLVR